MGTLQSDAGRHPQTAPFPSFFTQTLAFGFSPNQRPWTPAPVAQEAECWLGSSQTTEQENAVRGPRRRDARLPPHSASGAAAIARGGCARFRKAAGAGGAASGNGTRSSTALINPGFKLTSLCVEL